MCQRGQKECQCWWGTDSREAFLVEEAFRLAIFYCQRKGREKGTVWEVAWVP